MSRGEDVRVGSRQNTGRYLQISESGKSNEGGKKKSGNARQSQKFHSSNGIGSKQLTIQDLVKVPICYPSGIGFRGSKTVEESKSKTVTNFPSEISRSRIAEMLALSGYQTPAKEKKDKKGSAESVGADGGAGHQHRSAPEIAAREPASNEFYRLGASANVDIVHAAVLNFKSLRKSDRRSLDTLDHEDMASTRGQNVSILHLRGPPDPWDPPITSFTDAGGSLRSTSKINSFQTNCGAISSFQNDIRGDHSGEIKMNGTLPSSTRKRDSGSSNSVSLFIASGVNSTVSLNSANRELSPVRWCDREVDGVYLGRSGWVQVQQRSLDESRKMPLKNGSKNVPLASTLNRLRISHYHYNSESEAHAEFKKERPRPDYLPLPIEINRNRENHKTSSPLISEYDSLSPPSITPIISPPPAFQDPGSEQFQVLSRNPSGKPPFLSRSKAVMDTESPPGSPPNWSSRSRFKKLTPSPASSQQHILVTTQTKSLEDNIGTRRNQFQRFVESSTSSSSSSFGFRSLDGSVGRSSTMPRLNETDSSADDCEGEDGGEDYTRSRGKLKSPPPEPYANGERVSPSAPRHRNSQRIHAGRKTPSTDANGKKYGMRSSSSSESCSSCERKSPSANFRRYNHRQSRGDIQSNSWDVRNSRVRRSKSLQLPEKRSPSVPWTSKMTSSREHLSPEYPVYPNYKNNGSNSSGPYRVVVKVNGEAMNVSERQRRFVPKKAQSEEARYEELRRETEEETRKITDYLNSTRSRAAARDLLMHRYLNRPEEANRGSSVSTEVAADPLHAVYFSGNRRSSSKKGSTQRNSHGYPSPSNPNPCNPTTCDFWPHCAHRDVITLSKPSQAVASSPNMKPSQSYPAVSNQNHQRKEEKQKKENRSSSVRSSPASAESTEFGKENWKPSSVKSSPDSRMEKRTSGAHKRPNGKVKYREGSSSSTSSSEVQVVASGKSRKGSEASTPLKSYDSNRSKSPKQDEGSFSPRPGSAPTDDIEEDAIAVDAQRRSLSLPKSFLSNGFKNSKQSWHAASFGDVHVLADSGLETNRPQANSMEDGLQTLGEKPRRSKNGTNGLFPWRRQFVSGNASLRPLTPETSKTAPATPVREAGSAGKEKERSKQPQYIRSSSAPFLDEPPEPDPDWGSRRDISLGTEDGTKETNSRLNQKELLGQRNNIGNQTSESVLQKFKKSFSLRFHKAQKGSLKDDVEDVEDLAEEINEEEQPQQLPEEKITEIPKEEGTYDQKFRFGPLVWRSSKERKKGKKAVRDAKCNSGDSGIQIESSLHLPGDSSESHDTDQHEDLDSPPMIRRRPASKEKSSRPQSEVINQILIDKFKADLQWRTQAKGYPNRRVRRTNSDLGGQRLFSWELRNSYRRMLSTPSPIKGRQSRMMGRKSSPEGPAPIKRRLPGRAQLRRSMSQPLGLNELSPLMRRKHSVVRNQILSEDEHEGRGGTSDDEALSDSESSVTSLNDRKKSFEAAMDEEMVILAEAVWDHVAMEPEELVFRAGEVIEVLDTLDRDWWWGATGNNYGWFPSAFVRLRVSQEDTVEDCLEAMASGAQTTKQLRRRTSISLLSNDQVRSSVVRELLNTERDFVKTLRDVTEGYIAECRRRTDMFTPSQIETIFGNLEDLLNFQIQFLEDLELRVDKETPHRSCVGEIFLKHRAGFRMYSEYCNSHPMAIASLQDLYQRNNYSKFFEACRLMRGLIEIPLDGYLLTPIQRICKYPLQLAELLKYTKSDHPDHESVKEALETMRGVAVLINERKRRMESLEKLAAWQHRVEGWEGEDLIEVSTQLIYQGEAIRVTSGMWTSNVTLFLFDHQLVYCKKDLLKRNTYVYKGRICMDTSEVINIPDGKDPQSGVTIRHGLKIYSCIRDKWLLFCCRTGEEKSKWLEALAEERKLVAQDRQSGLELPPAARHLARMVARSKRRPPVESRGKAYKRESHYNGYKVGRKVGTWFTFGGAKKSSRTTNLRKRSASQHVT